MKLIGLFFKLGCMAVLLLLGAGTASADIIELEPTRDNTLYESATGALSNGSGESLFSGKTADNMIRRAVVAFDVASQIPEGSIINGTSLKLSVTRSQTTAASLISIHSVNQGWGEGLSNAAANEGSGATSTNGDATWIHSFFPNSFWSSPGGDFNPTASGTISVGGVATYTWSSPQLVADVQNWVDNPGDNFGWILIGNENSPGTAKRFASAESLNSGLRPRLTIDYTPPHAGGELVLTASVNQANFTTGETLQLSIGVNNPGQNNSVDVYLAILLPDGNTMVNVINLDGTVEIGSISTLEQLTPMVGALPLSGAFNANLSNFFTHAWTGNEPNGNYIVFFVMTTVGAFDDGSIDPGDLVRFASATFRFSP